MSWTDDRVATLKKLWGEGKTAAEIAKELGGVTRNAVIGKAHRLKLSNRVSPIQQSKKVAAPKPQNQNKKPAEPGQPRKKIKEYVDDGRERIPLSDLKPGQCRWPMGDPRDKDFGFCGCKALPNLPYCLEHAQVAYQPATRNRILKEQGTVIETVSKEELEAAKAAVAVSK
ncbi:MAG: GcrA family cell cycle regulator [Bdellovibrionales bacterium]